MELENQYHHTPTGMFSVINNLTKKGSRTPMHTVDREKYVDSAEQQLREGFGVPAQSHQFTSKHVPKRQRNGCHTKKSVFLQ